MFSISSELTKLNYPYFHARKRGGQTEVHGSRKFCLGHKLAANGDGKPDGVYAEWHWDGDRLVVRNDWTGFYPLFYSCRDGEIALSPSPAKLIQLGAPADLDKTALSVFFRLGYFLGEDTPFQHIRALPPDATLEWNGSLKVSGQRRIGASQRAHRDDAIDAYIELFRKSVERRLPRDKNFATPISGGRDSRHILLELCRAGCRPKYCITTSRFPPRTWLDLDVAREVAFRLHVNHVVVGPPPRFQAERRNILETHFCADEHAWVLGAVDHLKATVSTTYHGIGGDDLVSNAYINPRSLDLYRSGRLTELADLLLGPDSGSLEEVLQAETRDGMGREVARSRLLEELHRYVDAPGPLRMFTFWNRTRREIALVPYGLLRDVPTTFCPHVDRELFGLLASLPDEMLVDGKFHDDAIRRAHPEYADMPFAAQRPRGLALAHLGRYVGQFAGFAAATNLSWCLRNHHLVWRWLRCAASSGYRQRNRMWLSPTRLLYIVMLEAVRALRA